MIRPVKCTVVRGLGAWFCLSACLWAAAGTARSADWSPYEPLPASAIPIPEVADAEWSRNPVDAFIRAKLTERGLEPAGEVDRGTWLRRVTYDLIGLPPTPEELAEFVADSRPDAIVYSEVVDRLLASPHYGERWARHWLDVVRYADTDGFAIDAERPSLWRYRDYVIRHFNQDRPYDQFVREQLAGDELSERRSRGRGRANPEAVIATSFYRLGPYEADNMVPENRQQDFLNEMTTTIGTAFLGLTVGCARCHDHKYDPIPQEDFYRLQAFLKPGQRGDTTADFLPEELLSGVEQRKQQAEAQMAELQQAWEAHRGTLREQLAAALGKKPDEVEDEIFQKVLAGEKIPLPVVTAVDGDDSNPAESGDEELGETVELPDEAVSEEDPPSDDAAGPEQAEAASGDENPTDQDSPPSDEPPTFQLDEEARAEHDRLKKAVDDFEDHKRFAPSVNTITGPRGRRSSENPVTRVLLGGDVFAEGDVVEPGCLSAVESWSDEIDAQVRGAAEQIRGRRRALAEWVASPRNPLTARVYVNRVWQFHFGTGIVRTSNDFGENGSGPTHPELLDYLAQYFLQHEQRTKPLHRLIVLSRTYRTASRHPEAEDHAQKDPDNRFLWRAPWRRLEAEAIRDAMLMVSGRLNTERGGPGFLEALPDGLPVDYPFFRWVPSDESQRRRRSIYMFLRRNLTHPLMESFDVADSSQSCEQRSRSVTPSQALALFNGNLAAEASRHLAHRLTECSTDSPDDRIRQLFLLTLSRPPEPEELEACRETLAAKVKRYSTQAEESVPGEGEAESNTETSESSGDELLPDPELRALRDLCLVILNTNEFMFLD